MSDQTSLSIISQYMSAWNDHDPQEIANYFANDCLYEDAALGFVYRSPQDIAQLFQKFFHSYPNIQCDFTNLFGEAERAAWEWRMEGNYERTGPSGIPASGQRVTFRGASIAQVADGKIVRVTDYWNVPNF